MDNILRIALKNVEQMLEDRKYIPISNGYPKLDIIERMKNRNYITQDNKKVIVAIVESTSQIKNYSKYLNDNLETIIFIYLNTLTIAHKAIEKNLDYIIEIWSVYDLLINVSTHYLQPKIEKVSDTDIVKHRIPKIAFYDPIIRYYKYKQKDILKITNKNGAIHYRIVI